MKTNPILTFIFKVVGGFCFFISSVAMTIWWYSKTYKSSNSKEAKQ